MRPARMSVGRTDQSLWDDRPGVSTAGCLPGLMQLLLPYFEGTKDHSTSSPSIYMSSPGPSPLDRRMNSPDGPGENDGSFISPCSAHSPTSCSPDASSLQILSTLATPPSFFAFLRNQCPLDDASHDSPVGRRMKRQSPLLQLGAHDDSPLDEASDRWSSPQRQSRRVLPSHLPAMSMSTTTTWFLLLGLVLLVSLPCVPWRSTPFRSQSFPQEWSEPWLVVLQATPYHSQSSPDVSTVHSLIDPESPALPLARTFCVGLHETLLTQTTPPSTKPDAPSLRVASYYYFQEQDLHWLASPWAASDGSVSTMAIQWRQSQEFEQRREQLRRIVQDYTAAFLLNYNTTQTYFTVELTGWEDMMEPSPWWPGLGEMRSVDWNRETGWLLMVSLAGLWILGVMAWKGRARPDGAMPSGDEVVTRSDSRAYSCVRQTTVALASWLATMTLWTMVDLVVSQFSMLESNHYRSPVLFVSSLAYTACLVANLLMNPGRNREKHLDEDGGSARSLFAWTAVTAFICVGSFWIAGSKGWALSTMILIVVFLLVQQQLLPRFTSILTVESSNGCSQIPASSPTSRSSIIRTTADFYSVNEDDDEVDLELSGPDQHPFRSPGSYLEQQEPLRTPKSFWFSLSRSVLLHSYRSLIVILLVSQLVYHLSILPWNLPISMSLDSLLSEHVRSRSTWSLVQQKSQRPGHVAPFKLVFDGHSANISMQSSEAFQVMHLVVEELMATEEQYMEDVSLEHSRLRNQGVTHLGMTAQQARELAQHIGAIVNGEESDDEACEEGEKLTARGLAAEAFPSTSNVSAAGHKHFIHHRRALYNGIAVIHNTRLPHSVYSTARYCNKIKPQCPFELLHAINMLDQWQTSSDTLSTTVTVELGIDPFSSEGEAWLASVYSTIDRLIVGGVLRGIDVHILGAAANEYDFKTNQMKSAMQALCTAAVVIAVSSMLFSRSVLLGLLSIFASALTLCLSFGCAGYMLKYSEVAVNWRTILPASILITCLSMASNHYFLSHVMYHRKLNYMHRSAIAAGLDASGIHLLRFWLIVSLSFCCCAFISHDPMTKQYGILMAVASSVDVLVVRLICFPIILDKLGPSLSWWPRDKIDETAVTRLQGFEDEAPDDLSDMLRIFESTSEYQALTPRASRR